MSGAPQAFPGQAPGGFQGMGGPFAQPGNTGIVPPQGPQGSMSTQVMPPNYQQGMNQAMRPPMPQGFGRPQFPPQAMPQPSMAGGLLGLSGR
jgi:hypothetical protein